MKKICYVTTVSITIKSFVLKSAEYLHDNGNWDITIICDYDKELKDSLPEYMHYHPIPMKRGISLSGICATNQMRKFFKKNNFDIIQYSTPNASLYASLAGFFANVPIRLYCQWGIKYIGFNGLKKKVFKLIEKLICVLSTWIEPDSYSNLKFAHNEKLYSISKGSVIWNGSACGIDLKKFNYKDKEKFNERMRKRYNISKNAFVFGFVGRITRDKGVNELLTVCKDILQTTNNTYVLLVGSEEIDSTVDKNLYKWSKECNRIIYCGHTNVVEQYLSMMDCYILPSYREGFGMGVVEAEAMGVPVIVTNIPGPIDAMKENETGLIVEKKDTISLKKAMIKLLENKDLCVKFGNNGIKFARENFDQQTFFSCLKLDRENLLNKYLIEGRTGK